MRTNAPMRYEVSQEKSNWKIKKVGQESWWLTFINFEIINWKWTNWWKQRSNSLKCQKFVSDQIVWRQQGQSIMKYDGTSDFFL